MRYCCITLVLILLLGLVPFVALYGQTAEITEIGSFYSGYGNLIAYQSSGDYAYVLFKDTRNNNHILQVFLLDGVNASPTECRLYLPNPEPSTHYRHMLLDEQKLVFFADEIILVYEIISPLYPVLSASLSCQGTATGAVLRNGYLITSQANCLRSYDLSNASTISLADSIYTGSMGRVFKTGDDAVIISGSPCIAFHIAENGTFGQQYNLELTNSYDLAGVWNNLAFTWNWVYVCAYDISDLGNPVLQYQLLTGPSRGVLVLDGFLVFPYYVETYHATNDWTLIYDISGSEPVYLTYGLASATDTFCSDSTNRYLRSTKGKLIFSEVSETPVYGNELSNRLMSSISASNAAVFAGAQSGVQILDPTSPDINLGLLAVEDERKSAARGNLLVTTSYYYDYIYDDERPNSIRLWNVFTPSNPILRRTFVIEGSSRHESTKDIRFDGDILLLLSQSGYVNLYDISELIDPISLGLIGGIDYPYSADLSGSFLYLAYNTTASNNLRIYQWSAGETPVQVASLNLASRGMKLDEVDGKLFVSTNDGHLLVYDVTNPNSPQLISDTDLGSITDFAVKDDALVVLGNSAVRVYGITPAGLTELVASHIVPESSAKLAIHDNMVYVQEGYRLIYLDCTAAFNATVSNSEHSIPSPVIRLSAYPNPFSGATTLSFDLKSPERVQMSIYNIRGQKLLDILDTNLARGSHQIAWDGRDASGKAVSTGVYFCRLKAGGKEVISRMAVVH